MRFYCQIDEKKLACVSSRNSILKNNAGLIKIKLCHFTINSGSVVSVFALSTGRVDKENGKCVTNDCRLIKVKLKLNKRHDMERDGGREGLLVVVFKV